MLDGNNQFCAYELTAGNTKIEKNGSCDNSGGTILKQQKNHFTKETSVEVVNIFT